MQDFVNHCEDLGFYSERDGKPVEGLGRWVTQPDLQLNEITLAAVSKTDTREASAEVKTPVRQLLQMIMVWNMVGQRHILRCLECSEDTADSTYRCTGYGIWEKEESQSSLQDICREHREQCFHLTYVGKTVEGKKLESLAMWSLKFPIYHAGFVHSFLLFLLYFCLNGLF